MAMAPISLPAAFFTGDTNAQLVAGDAAAVPVVHNNVTAWAFDDTAEEAIISGAFPWPTDYASGTVTARIAFYTASDNTNDVAFDVFVQAVTSNADTLNMGSATSWDTANSGTASVSGTTAGDLRHLDITLTNKDSVAAGDDVIIGVRRDTDSGNDDIVGDVFVRWVRLTEA